MNLHNLPTDSTGSDSMTEYLDYSLIYDLQKC
jgi:hypothetical protein